jgi:predicted dehydrogenase
MNGKSIAVKVATTWFAALEFAQGAVVSLALGWDTFKHAHRPIELHGIEGSMRAPDPNYFGGTIEYTKARSEWQAIETRGDPCGKHNFPDADPAQANYRMLGVAEMAAAIQAGRAPRTGAEVSQHVLEVMEGIHVAGETGRTVRIDGGARPPAITDAEIRALLVDPAAVCG